MASCLKLRFMTKTHPDIPLMSRDIKLQNDTPRQPRPHIPHQPSELPMPQPPAPCPRTQTLATTTLAPLVTPLSISPAHSSRSDPEKPSLFQRGVPPKVLLSAARQLRTALTPPQPTLTFGSRTFPHQCRSALLSCSLVTIRSQRSSGSPYLSGAGALFSPAQSGSHLSDSSPLPLSVIRVPSAPLTLLYRFYNRPPRPNHLSAKGAPPSQTTTAEPQAACAQGASPRLAPASTRQNSRNPNPSSNQGQPTLNPGYQVQDTMSGPKALCQVQIYFIRSRKQFTRAKTTLSGPKGQKHFTRSRYNLIRAKSTLPGPDIISSGPKAFYQGQKHFTRSRYNFLRAKSSLPGPDIISSGPKALYQV
ncbi:WAS/WASL-interacting protein family member 3-like [Penaeus monodon]|uniref:WAS/WASL-interacting protein family member 3-like n=1 Tax=Penaeus monodon TaxID=6687 RepID=UPI0018A7A3CF|nr:WAS/WASL-interacting protein family member 3-like [Penaeus monodon]